VARTGVHRGSALTVTGDELRGACSGVAPLPARLEPWQVAVMSAQAALSSAIRSHGSPVNVLDPGPMERNVEELRSAVPHDLTLRVFFARKSNKALAFVDEARRLGLGVDVASDGELRQVMDRGLAPNRVIVTAAVKPRPFLERCAATGVTVALDNLDELRLAGDVAAAAGTTMPVAIRLALRPADGATPTRFGMDPPTIRDALDEPAITNGTLVPVGVHFHADGYRVADRVNGVDQALEAVAALRTRGHRPAFVDIGGGIPMAYLERDDWERFWDRHRREPVTFDRHPLGSVYPMWQSPTRGAWLREVLTSRLPCDGREVGRALADEHLALHCEPGRSLLDGCGMTVARVEFRKPHGDGGMVVGVAMNRTQCRSATDDCMLDPLLLPTGDGSAPPAPAEEGYLVGAYCIERELLTWRRMRFPRGVRPGDLIVFPNTAGYLMHILESASHQIPLARNLVHVDGTLHVDAIDDPDRPM